MAVDWPVIFVVGFLIVRQMKLHTSRFRSTIKSISHSGDYVLHRYLIHRTSYCQKD